MRHGAFTADRRGLLSLLIQGGVAGMTLGGWTALHASGLSGRRHVEVAPRFMADPFSLGVAAGEPEPDGFVIWTRLAPEPLAPHGGMAPSPVLVRWEVAEDENFRLIVRQGENVAHPELAHAVHVEVAGLRAHRRYFYRFASGNAQSRVGSAHTLPLPDALLDRLRFIAAGCQNYEHGFYTAWRHVAAEAPDFVFHYGDYIYEGGDAPGQPRSMYGMPFTPVRRHGTPELYSLEDYRRRYALYKADPDLQAAHAACAFFVSFDDHEIDNNWAGLHDQDGTPPQIFAFRKAAALQAFYEHMPLRRRSMPVNGHMAMHRMVRFGDLVNGWFLDTRQYRSDQPCGDGIRPFCAEMADPARTMLGMEQEAWLSDGLAGSKARWNMLAQQVLMMNPDVRTRPGDPERLYATDTWSGYLAARERLLAEIDRLGLTNVAILSGDSHKHYVGDVALEALPERVVASEFLATSISSDADGFPSANGAPPHRELWLRNNPHLKVMDDRRGYIAFDITPDLWRADMRIIDTVQNHDGALSTLATYVLENGARGLHRT